MQTMSNADADADSNADGIHTKSNMSPSPSVGGDIKIIINGSVAGRAAGLDVRAGVQHSSSQVNV